MGFMVRWTQLPKSWVCWVPHTEPSAWVVHQWGGHLEDLRTLHKYSKAAKLEKRIKHWKEGVCCMHCLQLSQQSATACLPVCR
jgi:hypothetical protein